MIGAVTFDRERGELEVSYQFLPEFWGQGLGTEAVSAALGWAWGNTDDTSIIAVTQTANKRSIRLLASLGFVPDHEFEEFGAQQSQLRLSRPVEDLQRASQSHDPEGLLLLVDADVEAACRIESGLVPVGPAVS